MIDYQKDEDGPGIPWLIGGVDNPEENSLNFVLYRQGGPEYFPSMMFFHFEKGWCCGGKAISSDIEVKYFIKITAPDYTYQTKWKRQDVVIPTWSEILE